MSTPDIETSARPEHNRGTVIKKFTGIYHVDLGAEVVVCSYSSPGKKDRTGPSSSSETRNRGKASGKGADRGDPIAIGDDVRIVAQPGGPCRIAEVLPRRTQLSRRSAVPRPGAHPYEQVIVANADLVVPVFATADPPPHWNMLDRYLVTAEKAHIPALICITKTDLAADGAGVVAPELTAVLAEYHRLGYPAVLTSVLTGTGLQDLKQAITGRVSVLVGKSGVGKTSLLNALQPGLGLRVNEVNSYTRKGKHTTTNLEMFSLDGGGALIDTPGVREFGLWDVEADELAGHFPEMRPYLGRCRYGFGCLHIEEPGCAVRKAVMGGHIHPRRYQSYMHLIEEP